MLINYNILKCPICNSESTIFHSRNKIKYFLCSTCKCIFVHPENLPNYKTEKSRYEKHQNNTDNKGYINFISPIINTILLNHTIHEEGLDYGAGPNDVLAQILRNKKYQITSYDPFFFNDKYLLSRQYDYIICCEVIEHFHNPMKDFRLLYKLLKPGGSLYCMTDIYNNSIDFASWYYKNDITHVTFYQEETFLFLKRVLKFVSINFLNRLIILKK